MSKNTFEKLSKKLKGKGDVSVSLPDDLSQVLEDHLDIIAAAHHSNHVNDHHSHPGVEGPMLGNG